ncbi:MAG TPA: carboxypeptidase M32 [Chitinophagaceae bacterium]|nr:carboxypeptidase M32 [Chitinophagaceae bacterium]
MIETTDLYQAYTRRIQKIADLKFSSAVLQWDQETYMPEKGSTFRGQQLATLSELSHELFTASDTQTLLLDLLGRSDLSATQKRNAELTFEDYTKLKKLPTEFVRKMTETINRAFHSWIEARRENNFKRFENDLAKLVELKRQEAEYLEYKEHPYNALLNDYEKGATVAMIDSVFQQLIPELKGVLDKIQSAPQVDDSFLLQNFPKQTQWEFGMELLKNLHYDFSAGRQDISEHPFSTSFSPQDVRITTRILENDFGSMTWSCIHELGHALYEQGLPLTEYGLPLGEACSFSIHESQSRLWENQVGRSLGFWQHYYPLLLKYFPEQLKNVSVEQFWKGINKVQSSLVRTEADEVTYHFHVYIRYELEKRLIENSISVKDIPSFWNENYKKYLGVAVPDDLRGCLQDVHWSHGSFGYFPTYSLGSFFAAQFYTTALKQVPEIENDIREGKSDKLLKWLRENVHKYGRFYTSDELCRNISGEGLNTAYFIQYLLDKYRKIYQF